MTVSLWRRYEIAQLPPGTLTAILLLAREFAEQEGRAPTAADLQAAVRRP